VLKVVVYIVLFTLPIVSFGQGFTRYTYHDAEKKHIKEVYAVKDTIKNIAHGKYLSYYLNGVVESKGEFLDNETTGVWEFFYETGKLKMRGILFKGANYGMWEYYYVTGKKSMEGIVYGKNREGEWKTYYENGQLKEVGEYSSNKRNGYWKAFYEDGKLKGEGDYKDDVGTYTEFFPSGKVMAKGNRESGVIEREGNYLNNKKEGEWKLYFPSGKLYAQGNYQQDVPVGYWYYYFDDGTLSSSGEFSNGDKVGVWKTMNKNGTVKSEATYQQGGGEIVEYHANGQVKAKGTLRNGKRQGKWEFFYENGNKEGVCDYDDDKGTYFGYYPDGKLQTKGMLEGDKKVGTWEIYEKDGSLSGYYKPVYNSRAGEAILDHVSKTTANTKSKPKRNYLAESPSELKGVIVASNPLWLAAGKIPIGIEFYFEKRLGYEFEFIGIRDPFFTPDDRVALGVKYKRGYTIAIKQKFYNTLPVGAWYFGHEIRFTNLAHYVNKPLLQGDILTYHATEQHIQWGPLVGYRLTKKRSTKGLTLDAFMSYNLGYRNFYTEPIFETQFATLNQSKFVTTFNVGLNIGKLFSYD
jgi:antitoxin component YwqK of YwqJK toxin-antitoxin module